MKIVNATSNNFELYLTIPSQCVNSAEIDVEVNGSVFSIQYVQISSKIILLFRLS